MSLINNKEVDTSINKADIFLSTDIKPNKVFQNKNSGTLQVHYHVDELTIHKRINDIASGIIIISFIVIIASIVYMCITGNIQIGLISTTAGILSEAISGILFSFVTKAGEDKWKYFGVLSETEEEARIVDLINSSENSEFRDKMVEKLVDAYCENKKKKYVA